jgi:SAM-dependent methyltransferase
VAIPPDGSVPSMAGIYDAWLGGSDNFEPDRAGAAEVARVYSGVAEMVRYGREFTLRAVTWAARRGIAQFADLGCGLPTRPAVHEAAREAQPLARVAYADIDPLVVSHVAADIGRERDAGGLAAVQADIGKPGAVLAAPALRRVICLDEPVCLILAMVLHFLPADRARETAAAYAEAIAPGSVVVISTGRNDDPAMWERVRAAYGAAPLYNHTREQVAGFFAGVDVVPPGLVVAQGWRPDWACAPAVPPGPGYVLAGAGVKPCRAGA